MKNRTSYTFHDQVRKQVEGVIEGLKRQANNRKPPPITTGEVRKMLKRLPNSSPNPEAIHNLCLRNFTTSIIQHLVKSFNTVIDIEHIPKGLEKCQHHFPTQTEER